MLPGLTCGFASLDKWPPASAGHIAVSPWQGKPQRLGQVAPNSFDSSRPLAFQCLIGERLERMTVDASWESVRHHFFSQSNPFLPTMVGKKHEAVD